MTNKEVDEVLDDIRPWLRADGGDVELVSVEDGVVKVKFLGGCAGCPFSNITLQMGIENYLKQKLPEIKQVVSV